MGLSRITAAAARLGPSLGASSVLAPRPLDGGQSPAVYAPGMEILRSPWILPLGPLLLGLVLPRMALDAPPRRGLDLCLGLLCAVLLPGLGGAWLARFMMRDRFMGSDLGEYCGIVADFGQPPPEGAQRSELAAAVPGLLAQHVGVIDGLAWGALLSAGAAGLGLYLWGRAVAGPVAGVLSVLFALSWEPTVAMTRTLSLYPELAGGFTLAGGLVAYALRDRGAIPALLAAFGAALCFVVDLRGLMWGLPLLGLALLIAAFAPAGPWRLARGFARLAVVLALMGASYRLGERVYAEKSVSLERLTLHHGRLSEMHIDADQLITSRYVWGHTNVSEIPETLSVLARGTPFMRRAVGGKNHEALSIEQRALWVTPWLPLWAGAALLTFAGLTLGAERRWRALALIGVGLPFAVALEGAVTIQFSFARQLALGFALPALCLGVGFVSLQALASRLPIPRLPMPARIAPVLPGLGAVLVAVGLVLGGLPSWLGPNAPWRSPMGGSDARVDELVTATHDAAAGRTPTMWLDERGWACVNALVIEARAGGEVGGRLWR